MIVIPKRNHGNATITRMRNSSHDPGKSTEIRPAAPVFASRAVSARIVALANYSQLAAEESTRSFHSRLLPVRRFYGY
jgi:hypothetical protein